MAAVVIGDEILSGKVDEANMKGLIGLCRERGAHLGRIACVGDDPEAIAEEVGRCAAGYDLVVTSGGVGPTHDDRTVEGVARAFGLEVVRHPDLEAMIRGWWGDRVTDAALGMADVPVGAELIFGADRMLPIVVCRNVYLLPGVPRLFTRKLAVLGGVLSGVPVILGSLYLAADESSVAGVLAEAHDSDPEVAIGSYPRSGETGQRVWVTVEGTEAAAVQRTIDRLLARLPSGTVVRTIRP